MKILVPCKPMAKSCKCEKVAMRLFLASEPYVAARNMGYLKDVSCLIVICVEIRLLVFYICLDAVCVVMHVSVVQWL